MAGFTLPSLFGGVQSTISFGSLDVVLPLPGDLPAERIWMEGKTLYALSGKRVFRRELLVGVAKDEVQTKPASHYYGIPGENRNSCHRPLFEESFKTLGSTVITNRIQAVRPEAAQPAKKAAAADGKGAGS